MRNKHGKVALVQQQVSVNCELRQHAYSYIEVNYNSKVLYHCNS